MPSTAVKIQATQTMPGPMEAMSCGDGSKANVKMNATTKANASTEKSVSRVRSSRRTSLA